MKKVFTLIVAVITLLACLISCNQNGTSEDPHTLNLPNDNIKQITVTSSPEGYDYSFDSDGITAIVDYLSSLNLSSDFKVNPGEYDGMIWVISLEYENDETATVYLGSPFIKTADGPWYKISTEDALRFETLLNEFGKPNIFDNSKYTAYLDEINFIPELSQSQFVSQMKKYLYNGTSIEDLTIGHHYDGEWGGGYAADGELFGFRNDYTVMNSKQRAIYSNRLYSTVKLDGIALPCEINFGDTLTTVLGKLQIDTEHLEDFASNEVTVTLCINSTSSLKLSPSTSQFKTMLKYTESYNYTRSDGRNAYVTRYILMSFTDNDNTLERFEVSVSEDFEID